MRYEMIELLLGFLLGVILAEVARSLIAHVHDLIVRLKDDVVAIKDKILILLHIKSASVSSSVPPSAPTA